MASALNRHYIVRLRQIFEDILEDVNEQSWEQLLRNLQWVELHSGEILFREGDPGDNFYIVLSGRLQAQVQEPNGQTKRLGTIGRSEFIGEMSLLTGERRTATVIAQRDSLLAAAPKAVFDNIFEMFPGMVRHIVRNLVVRLKNANTGWRASGARYGSIALLPLSPNVETRPFVQALVEVLATRGKTVLLDRAACNAVIGQREKYSESEWRNKRMLWLNEKEATHDFIVYWADPEDTDWTERCLRQADVVLLLADADGKPDLTPIEKQFLPETDPIHRFLVLLHPAGKSIPTGTRHWLEGRRLDRHIHVRLGYPSDVERLERFLNGRANGFVLAGGAARGMAHLGIYRALLEHGIPLDLFGGTSAGSLVAGIIALHHPYSDRVMHTAREMAASNPTKGDYHAIPYVSLMSGKRLRNTLSMGFGAQRIEDLWYDFRCVSSNLMQSCEAIHQNGILERAIRASCSIPGVFPPVVFGNDLHVDGGAMNNLPIDVLREAGAGRIIAADLETMRSYNIDYPEMPTSSQLLFDRFFWKKGNQAPTILETIMKASVLGSDEKARRLAETAELFFKPDVRNVGYLDWSALESTVQLGYDYARRMLETVDPVQWR